MSSGVATFHALLMCRMRVALPPLSVTSLPPSMVVSFVTGSSAVTVMVTGAVPQSNVTMPPAATAAARAVSVQLAARAGADDRRGLRDVDGHRGQACTSSGGGGGARAVVAGRRRRWTTPLAPELPEPDRTARATGARPSVVAARPPDEDPPAAREGDGDRCEQQQAGAHALRLPETGHRDAAPADAERQGARRACFAGCTSRRASGLRTGAPGCTAGCV